MAGGFSIGEVEVTNEVSLAPSAALREGAVETDGDLSVLVNSFHFDIGGTNGKFDGALNQAVVDNTTNYVFLDAAAVLQINITGYPAAGISHIRLARVITSGGFITRIILERPFFSTGGGGIGATAKSGKLIPGNFTGSPLVASVAFGTAYPDTNYTITLGVETSGVPGYSLKVENKATTGFDVHLGSSVISGVIEILWQTMPVGE